MYSECVVLVVAVLLVSSSRASVVIESPVDTSRDPGEWAEFTCSVACSHSIDWFVEGYLGEITDVCSATRNGMMACKVVTQGCSSSTSTFGYTETLRVLAKPELASSNIAVQCAAVSRSIPNSNNCPPFLAYSRYALLSVNALPTQPPTTPPPPPPPSPSPSPVVCPSATQTLDVQISTITETVTATHTQVVTRTVTVTATPTLDIAARSRGSSPRSRMGRVLTELLSWGVAALASVLVL